MQWTTSVIAAACPGWVHSVEPRGQAMGFAWGLRGRYFNIILESYPYLKTTLLYVDVLKITIWHDGRVERLSFDNVFRPFNFEDSDKAEHYHSNLFFSILLPHIQQYEG